MDVGDRVVCLYDDWYNAYGDKFDAVHCGMRLTVSDTRNIAGTQFLAFHELPEDQLYLHTGFRPEGLN